MNSVTRNAAAPRFALPDYAELHCRSNFSFLTGASHPEELVERAIDLGYTALAITDECSLAGVVRAHVAARDRPLHLIVGAEMRLSPQDDPPEELVHTHPMRLVLLAQTRRGYGNLSQWITVARRRATKGNYLAHATDLEGHVPAAPMLAGLPDCLGLLVVSADQPFDLVFAQAVWLKTWFRDRAVLALELLHRAGDDDLLACVERVAALTGLPIVAAGDVLMHVRSRKALQDTLTATRVNRPVSACGWQLEPNAEQHLRSRARLAALYDPAWLDQSLVLAERCTFSLKELKYEYPQELVPPGMTPISHLRALTYAGVPKRFPEGLKTEHAEQIEKELGLIEQLKYEAYFLTVADIVSWARAQGILCQGRGSAANSLVCYCLQVTEVSPELSTMLFERFISAERNEPPDIDIDFEHQRREEVIQYLYRKYGRHRAALTAVVISYRPRSALRDVGRALGIDEAAIDLVAKSQQWFDGRSVDPARLGELGFDPEAPVTRRWIELTGQLIGFPRHLSQHPGGFVIAKDRIEQLVPVENAAMEGRSIVQWDKDDLDALGLIKVDILALGMLSALRRSLQYLSDKLGRPMEMQDIPNEDEATYEMICRADTVGVFQIESRAQMSMLPRLKPKTYYDLVVEVAIVRPGPIQGGMVHPYLLNREKDPKEITYPSKEIEPALKRTLGVPIFQEQVMQIAMLAADFTGGEADQLRRAMAAWKRKGGLGPFEKKLVGRMVEKGYEKEYADRIFRQIEGFGEYGFPESHAAGFALLAYASSWLKCHHPDVFLTGLLNSQPMGFYAPAQLVRDARAHGVEVRPVDVTVSAWDSALEGEGEPQRAVRLGLQLVKGLKGETARRLVDARAERPFASAEDLARRAHLDAGDLEALAQADALRTLPGIAGHRHQAAWVVAGIDTRPTELLRATRVHEASAELAAPAAVEDTLADYRSVGLTLKTHPLALLREQLDAFKVLPAAVLRNHPHGRLARASGLVTHRQRPPTAKGTMFVTLEDDTGAVNVIVWPKVVETQRKPLLGATLMTVFGQWQRQGEGEESVMHLVATKVIDHTPLLQGLVSRSRDFR
ncbi:error-prone DNA polymerase [Piscinibacter gummiphilus]|uniref:Error-prone DNA polymerase n=1 Tax=Piscinibacter gummiphilus TaxID=946333 RepID=A0A1W6LBB6_9BURK|nr:error-prone DNA polymerase [Piscinibacter gummiphilus]ARN21520.1 error-prone DNA polymerase [Piscinibacter gummiphilus]ATU66206.1 error-prone DNA polymerase [Piscinibacter gummiphilus]GLS96111.1 error-prone DNA polymerase [Piscinibacter gummiphilus]